MFSDLAFQDILMVVGCLLVSLTLHEAMHAFTAHALGDTTAHDEGRLTLNPLKHVDLMLTVALPIGLMLLHLPPFFIAKPVPFDPRQVKYGEYGAAMVALAGPFTNLLLAIFAGLMIRAGFVSDQFLHLSLIFVQVNIVFFVINMIPFPPLDGSRLLYAFAPEPLQRGMMALESRGLLPLIIFMLLLFPVLSPLIGNITQSIYQFILL